MADETPIVEAAKEAAHTPTLAELEAQVNKRKSIEDRIRFAAAQKAIAEVCEKLGVVLSAVPRITPDGRIGAEVALSHAPKPRTNGEHAEG